MAPAASTVFSEIFTLRGASGILPAMFLLRRTKKMFRFTSFCRFYQPFAYFFEFSRLVSLFSHSAKSDFEHQLLSKAIENEQSV